MQQQQGETLGRFIGEAMERDPRTRDQIAAAVGVEGSYLSKIKADQAMPSSKVLEDLIRELQLDAEKTHQLAAVAEGNRTIDKMRRQLLHGREYLRRHAPQVLQEVLEPAVQALSGLPAILPLLNAVYQGFLQSIPAASGPGQLILVIDTQQGTAYDVLMAILQGPDLTEEGEVVFKICIPDELPEACVLDLIFLFAVPAPECLYTQEIGPRERELLVTNGLTVRAPLPGASDILRPGVNRILRRKGAARHPVDIQGAFAFRIRC